MQKDTSFTLCLSEGCERNLGVVTLKSEHFAGGVDTAAECETRLDSYLKVSELQDVSFPTLKAIQ